MGGAEYVVADDVAALVGEEILARLRSRPRAAGARCFVCDKTFRAGSRSNVVALVEHEPYAGVETVRVVLAHPDHHPSAVVDGSAYRPPRLGDDTLIVPASRAAPPRSLLVVDALVEVAGIRSGRGEATDLRTAALLGAGFALVLDADLARLDAAPVAGWRARRRGRWLRVEGPDGPVLFEGELDVPAHWDADLAADGALLVVVGSRVGLDRLAPVEAIAASVSEGRLVAGVVAAEVAGQ